MTRDVEGDVATTRRDPGPASASADEGRPGEPDAGRRRWPTIILRTAIVVVLLALVGTTVVLRVELGHRRADAATAARAEVRAAEARREAVLLAAAVGSFLEQAGLDGDQAAAARREQGERLAELGLTEEDMEAALDEAQWTTRMVEAERDGLVADVERQRLEDVELQACLAEVRSAVDAAFHAANRDGVAVPPTREICRSLAAARSGS